MIRKKNDGAGFNLFSDIDSRINHLNRILVLIGLLGALELYAGVYNGLLGYFRDRSSVSLFAGIFCTLFGIIISYGFARIYIKINRLKRERRLHE